MYRLSFAEQQYAGQHSNMSFVVILLHTSPPREEIGIIMLPTLMQLAFYNVRITNAEISVQNLHDVEQ